MKKFPDETSAADVLEMRRFTASESGDNDEQPKKKVVIEAVSYRWRDPSTIPPRDWLYGRHYVRRYVTATIAPGGLGKSSLALVEALAMASGKPLLGQPVRTPFRVWYWNGEDPIDEIERRIAAICVHYGLSESDLGNRLHCDSGRTAPIKLAEMYRNAPIVKYAVVDGLAREIRARAIDLMIIDPFVSCHGVSENDNAAIDLVVKKDCGAIADRTSAAVELVHHVRKMSAGSSGEFTADDARGASALIGAARSVRVLNAMSSSDAQRFEIAEDQRRTYFRVSYDKSNLQVTTGTTMRAGSSRCRSATKRETCRKTWWAWQPRGNRRTSSTR
jgi:RecA-family ATPase